VTRAHGLEDALVGIAQKRSGLGLFTLALQRIAEAAREDRILNFVPAMFRDRTSGNLEIRVSQLKVFGGHVGVCT
jgi:hypothetical protein